MRRKARWRRLTAATQPGVNMANPVTHFDPEGHVLGLVKAQ